MSAAAVGISQDNNIKVALPMEHEQGEFDKMDTECAARAAHPRLLARPDPPARFCRRLSLALYISLGFLGLEMFGMLGGFSIFRSGVSLFYILMHFVGCVMLSFFITESWHYVTYWYIFAFCSAAPALLELWCAPRPRARAPVLVPALVTVGWRPCARVRAWADPCRAAVVAASS